MLKVANSIINASQIATPITLPGDVTLSTGNLVIGTSGKGIDFSATAGTGTSELLADYEEGDWTPAPTNLTVVGTPTYVGRYTKIGRQVFIHFTVKASTSTASTANSTFFSGLPFTVALGSTVSAVGNASISNLGVGLIDSSSVIYTPTWTSGANQTITLSGFYYV